MTPTIPRWQPASTPPPTPGWYWTRRIKSRTTDNHSVTTTTYTQGWLRWDGSAWSGELTDWYEREPR
jgi:hypothetical protein